MCLKPRPRLHGRWAAWGKKSSYFTPRRGSLVKVDWLDAIFLEDMDVFFWGDMDDVGCNFFWI